MLSFAAVPGEHPIDAVERLAVREDWTFERDGADEIGLQVEGLKADYQAAYTWLPDLEALHFSCSFPLLVSKARFTPIMQLIRKLNEQLWVGHFDYWPKENIVVFRHALLLPGATAPSPGQCAELLRHGTEACERYHEAFELTNWGGQTPDMALTSALFQIAGRA